MDIKITNSMTLALHKNFLCLFIKHYGIGIEIADERMLASDNETYRIGWFKLDRREIDTIMPLVLLIREHGISSIYDQNKFHYEKY